MAYTAPKWIHLRDTLLTYSFIRTGDGILPSVHVQTELRDKNKKKSNEQSIQSLFRFVLGKSKVLLVSFN